MKTLGLSLSFAVLTALTGSAAADNYPAVGHTFFKPGYLLPWTEQSRDRHCEATAQSLCDTVHDSAGQSYKAELVRNYCLSDQYEKCVGARATSTRY